MVWVARLHQCNVPLHTVELHRDTDIAANPTYYGTLTRLHWASQGTRDLVYPVVPSSQAGPRVSLSSSVLCISLLFSINKLRWRWIIKV